MAKKPPYAPDDPFSQHDFSWQNSRQAKGTDAGAQEGPVAGTHAGSDLPPYDPTGGAPLGGLFPETPQAAAASHEVLDAAHALRNFSAAISDEELARLCNERLPNYEWPGKKEAEDMRLRALADIDNAKKRLAREKEEAVRFAAESVLSDILPSLDTLELALVHASKTPAAKDLATGVEMTRKMLLEALAKHGLRPVGALGETFDPAVHEAVGLTNDPNIEDGQVCGLLSSGYQLKDRLLRPAKVMVCKKG